MSPKRFVPIGHRFNPGDLVIYRPGRVCQPHEEGRGVGRVCCYNAPHPTYAVRWSNLEKTEEYECALVPATLPVDAPQGSRSTTRSRIMAKTWMLTLDGDVVVCVTGVKAAPANDDAQYAQYKIQTIDDLKDVPTKALLTLSNVNRSTPYKKHKDRATAIAKAWLTFTTAYTAVASKSRKRSSGGGKKGPGIGAFCLAALKSGKTVAETLALVQAEFPTAKTSMGSVAWYKAKLGK